MKNPTYFKSYATTILIRGFIFVQLLITIKYKIMTCSKPAVIFDTVRKIANNYNLNSVWKAPKIAKDVTEQFTSILVHEVQNQAIFK